MKIKKLFIFENVILPTIPPDCNGLSNLLIKKRIFYIERRLLTLAPPLSMQTKEPFVQRTYEHQQNLHMLHFILINAQPTKKCPLGNEESHMSQSLLIFFLFLFMFLLTFLSFCCLFLSNSSYFLKILSFRIFFKRPFILFLLFRCLYLNHRQSFDFSFKNHLCMSPCYGINKVFLCQTCFSMAIKPVKFFFWHYKFSNKIVGEI